MWKHDDTDDVSLRRRGVFGSPAEREKRREYLHKKTEDALKALDAAMTEVSGACGTQMLDEEQALKMRDENLFLWICSMMKIAGTGLDISDVAHLMNKEEIDIQADTEIYRLLEACKKLYTEFLHMLDLDFYLNERYIIYINETLTGKVYDEYRTKNISLRTTGYPTPRADHVPGLMVELSFEIMNEFHGENEITNAIYAHDKIMQIWPFKSRNRETAYAVLSFMLFKAGYPLLTLDIDDTEHKRLLIEKDPLESESEFMLLVVESLLKQVRPR